jgi:hypothetical protein
MAKANDALRNRCQELADSLRHVPQEQREAVLSALQAVLETAVRTVARREFSLLHSHLADWCNTAIATEMLSVDWPKI